MEQIFESASLRQRADERYAGGCMERPGLDGVTTDDWIARETTDQMVTATIRARAVERRLTRELQRQRDLLRECQERLRQAEGAGDQQRVTEEQIQRSCLDVELQQLADQRAVVGSKASSLKHRLLMTELIRGTTRCD